MYIHIRFSQPEGGACCLEIKDDDEPEDEPVDDKQVPNLVLAQFENVKRVKNKWKVTLKDGICNLEGRDYMFHRGTGEFEW